MNSRCDAHEPRGETEHETAAERDIGLTIEKPRADGDVRPRLVERGDEAIDIFHAMLPITIEGHDDIRAAAQAVIDPGLDRRALSAIDDVSKDDCAGSFRLGGRTVRRAVVDHNDLWISRFD